MGPANGLERKRPSAKIRPQYYNTIQVPFATYWAINVELRDTLSPTRAAELVVVPATFPEILKFQTRSSHKRCDDTIDRPNGIILCARMSKKFVDRSPARENG